MEAVGLWPKNSLPVPKGLVSNTPDAGPSEQVIDVDDNFPKGRIHKYFPNQGYGYIKDRVGREVCFKLDEMSFVGSKDKSYLKKDVQVGYDVVHSGKELHVKKMKIY